MTSYNLVNEVHTSEYAGLIEDILRCAFGYQGIVMTDWVTEGCGENPDRIKAGLDNGSVTKKQLQINATRVPRMAKAFLAFG